jgi:hypothetical protein
LGAAKIFCGHSIGLKTCGVIPIALEIFWLKIFKCSAHDDRRLQKLFSLHRSYNCSRDI